MLLLRKHPETFTFSCFLPSFFVVSLVLGGLLAWLSPWVAFTHLSVLGLYCSAVLVTSVSIVLKKRDPKLLLRLPFVFAMIHVGAGFGTVREWVTGRRRPQSATLPGMIPEQSQ